VLSPRKEFDWRILVAIARPGDVDFTYNITPDQALTGRKKS
jgi:hypothetical protein